MSEHECRTSPERWLHAADVSRWLTEAGAPEADGTIRGRIRAALASDCEGWMPLHIRESLRRLSPGEYSHVRRYMDRGRQMLDEMVHERNALRSALTEAGVTPDADGVRELVRQRDEAQASCRHAYNAVAATEKRVNELDDELNRKIGEVCTERDDALARTEAAEKRADEAEGQRGKHALECLHMQRERDWYANRIAEAEDQRDEANRWRAEAERERDEAQANAAHWQRAFYQVEEQCAGHLKSAEAAEKERDELRHRLDMRKLEIAAGRTENDRLKCERDNAEQERHNIDKERRRLHGRVDELSYALDAAQSHARNMERDKDRSTREAIEAQRQLQELREAVRDAFTARSRSDAWQRLQHLVGDTPDHPDGEERGSAGDARLDRIEDRLAGHDRNIDALDKRLCRLELAGQDQGVSGG